MYVVMHDLRTHRLYLCVGSTSTAPSFDILLLIGDNPYQCDVMAVPWSLDLASSDMTSCKNNIKILLGLGLNIMCNKEETATTRVLVFTNLLNMLNLFLFLFNLKSAN